MTIRYYNGFYNGAEFECPKEIGQVKNAVITVINEGFPYRGRPEDMAKDALTHILRYVASDVGLYPVIFESYGGTDLHGDYTMKVVFQVVI